MDRIAVIGAGSWGTTVASLAAASTDTVLWARRSELADAIEREHVNPEYLPDLALPRALTATHDLEKAVAGAGAVVMAVPSHGFRDVFSQIVGRLSDRTPVVSLTKGIEQGSLARMTEIIATVGPGRASTVEPWRSVW